MNSLLPPTNPSEAYRAQLAAMIQLGAPLVKNIPNGVSTTIDTQCALLEVTQAFLKLRIALLKEEVGTQ